MVARAVQTTAHNDLISALVNTYRELNVHVRQLPENTVTTDRGDGSVRDIVRRMRYDEMRFAQALKQRVTGVVVGEPEGDERLAPDAVDEDTTAQLISQFGTARETTLSLLGNLSDEEWNEKADDGQSILQHAQALAESDRTQLERIRSLLT